jgi:hypothetical protein
MHYTAFTIAYMKPQVIRSLIEAGIMTGGPIESPNNNSPTFLYRWITAAIQYLSCSSENHSESI